MRFLGSKLLVLVAVVMCVYTHSVYGFDDSEDGFEDAASNYDMPSMSADELQAMKERVGGIEPDDLFGGGTTSVCNCIEGYLDCF
jgi:hypothetical protein